MFAGWIRESRGSTAIKAIVIIGIITFIGLWMLAAYLRRQLEPDERSRVTIKAPQSPFDGARAFRDLEHIVGLGPRPPGSKALEQTRVYLRAELEKAGFTLEEQPFTASTPRGKIEMVNLVAKVEGTREGIIVLGNHYDTKRFDTIHFVGANDGGSTTAWMLEFARALGPRREGRTVWLCWFDGEESIEKWTAQDSLYGSRTFVARLEEAGGLARVQAMINVDMIGDCYLGVFKDPGAPAWLGGAVWDTARRLGYERHFLRYGAPVEDDHTPFRKAAVPALEVIDFSYGGSMIEHRRNWHTARDTIERVCPESLQAVGDVIYHALTEIEARLDRAGE